MTPEEAKKAAEYIKPNPESGKSEICGYSQGHGHITPQTCPNCGYCPTCGRPRGNFNYPTYPYWGLPNTQPLTPMYQVWCSTTQPATSNPNVTNITTTPT